MADLVKRPAAGIRRGRQQNRGPVVEYLAFALAGEPYAAPVALVREILKPPPLTPVPRAPEAVLGIVSVRGQLVTVIDLRRRLRLPEEPINRRTRVLLVDTQVGETLGLLVDEVLTVYRLGEGEIEPAALALGNDVAPYIAGIARPGAGAMVASTSVPGAGEARPTLDRFEGVATTTQAPVIILLDLRAVLA